MQEFFKFKRNPQHRAASVLLRACKAKSAQEWCPQTYNCLYWNGKPKHWRWILIAMVDIKTGFLSQNTVWCSSFQSSLTEMHCAFPSLTALQLSASTLSTWCCWFQLQLPPNSSRQGCLLRCSFIKAPGTRLVTSPRRDQPSSWLTQLHFWIHPYCWWKKNNWHSLGKSVCIALLIFSCFIHFSTPARNPKPYSDTVLASSSGLSR